MKDKLLDVLEEELGINERTMVVYNKVRGIVNQEIRAEIDRVMHNNTKNLSILVDTLDNLFTSN